MTQKGESQKVKHGGLHSTKHIVVMDTINQKQLNIYLFK